MVKPKLEKFWKKTRQGAGWKQKKKNGKEKKGEEEEEWNREEEEHKGEKGWTSGAMICSG